MNDLLSAIVMQVVHCIINTWTFHYGCVPVNSTPVSWQSTASTELFCD